MFVIIAVAENSIFTAQLYNSCHPLFLLCSRCCCSLSRLVQVRVWITVVCFSAQLFDHLWRWDTWEKQGWSRNKEGSERRQRIQRWGEKIHIQKKNAGNKMLAAEKWRDILPFNPYRGEQVQARALCVSWSEVFVFQQQMLTVQIANRLKTAIFGKQQQLDPHMTLIWYL